LRHIGRDCFDLYQQHDVAAFGKNERTSETGIVGGPRTAIYAGLVGLTAVVLAVDTEPNKAPRGSRQTPTPRTETSALQLGKIRLELPIKPIDQGWTLDPLRRDPGRAGIDDRPISQVRLLDSDYLVADWRNGRVQYVVKGVNPWGASVGSQLSTSTAKVTLTWSFDD
jgi:hypothetical protein